MPIHECDTVLRLKMTIGYVHEICRKRLFAKKRLKENTSKQFTVKYF